MFDLSPQSLSEITQHMEVVCLCVYMFSQNFHALFVTF